MKKKILGYYDYTVILTYCGMLAAFVGIYRVIGKDFFGGIICLMIAGVCDMFDGSVASTKQRNQSQKNFGIQIDSLSDLISFGVFPALFVYMFMDCTLPAGIISAFYVLCALIRLAYFNVVEEERQQQTNEHRKCFLGVPVTTIALLLPGVYLIKCLNLCRCDVLIPIFLLLTAIGFIVPVEIRKPQAKGKVCMIVLGALEMLGFISIIGGGVL